MSAAERSYEEWIAARRLGVGGSEVAALCGEHPFLGPWDVYCDKAEGCRRQLTGPMAWGQYAEPGVAAWYAAERKVEVHECGHLVHPSRPRVMCSPDRLVNHPDGATRLLSIKVPSEWRDVEEWGERHHWRVPVYAYLQLQYELLVAGGNGLGLVRDDYAELAAPLGGELVVLRVDGDSAVQAKLADMVEEWWAKHVDTKTPPPLDGSDSAKQWIRRRFPASPYPVRDATPEEDVLAMEFKSAERAWEIADDAYDTVRQRLEIAIGASEGLRGAFGKVTMKTNAKGVRTLLTRWTGGLP